MPGLLTDCLVTATESGFEQDWARQRRTAEDILRRLRTQEGVILADQVGMGKTYVAMAVAASQILATPERARVVVFVPPAVATKWVREWHKFSETLLDSTAGIRCVEEPIRSGETFLAALDGSPEERPHLIVVTHTAFRADLKDPFVQLALLHYATRNIHGGSELRQRIARWADRLLTDRRLTVDLTAELLQAHPLKWQRIWESHTDALLSGNPVPAALDAAVPNIPMQALRETIKALPIRSSENIEYRLQEARKALAEAVQKAWETLLSSTDLDLPLLIVDEAHRLKNPKTLSSRLFGKRSANDGSGAFEGIFRRMLFLTATPFELGHDELIEVLSRMGAVRPLQPAPELALPERLKKLGSVLAHARITAAGLDDAWARLGPDDLTAFDAWTDTAVPPEDSQGAVREAWIHAGRAVLARREMHDALRPWVIRHERARRREYLPGAAILPDGKAASGGVPISDNEALPFLLAARAQSVALDEQSGRPLYAYGIASSYETFLREPSDKDAERDSDSSENVVSDGAAAGGHEISHAVSWYRREIKRAVLSEGMRDGHPKIRATVEKAAQLWLHGHKCLVFCWYIKTGGAVEAALLRRIEALVHERASPVLGTRSQEETKRELERLSDRLLRTDSTSYERLRDHLAKALEAAAGHNQDVLDLVVDVAIRHIRTSGYLVRYTRLAADMTHETIWNGIMGDNPGKIVLLDRWRSFAERLARARRQVERVSAGKVQDSEFERISTALLGVRTEDEQTHGRGASLLAVRRAHGHTRRDDRERLIALFNTPFAPDVLVASSVMGEGIDLHQECRHVIHHDLDWNPSVLEQRTGRLDRIGALAERERSNIVVYEPYLAGTHDEKMFRVVKDRAQWFDIVMGRAGGTDEHATDAEERRVPLHEKIHQALAMDLRSCDGLQDDMPKPHCVENRKVA